MINVSSPSLYGKELEYVTDAVSRGELTFGQYTVMLETMFAKFCGTRYAVACNNGTAALHLALLAQGVRPGDHVILPALTYVATANAVRYCGATPVFVDVDPFTWNIDVEDAARVIADLRKERARVTTIIPVHLYGVPCDMHAVAEVARKYRLTIIEDAAQAHGATYRSKVVGSIGDFGTFSFYGNKVMTCGEGGIVTTNYTRHYERLKLFRGQGVAPNTRYWHTVVGYNYRLSNVLAAIAVGQLESYQKIAVRRQQVFDAYTGELVDFQTQECTHSSKSANWMFTILVPKGVDRDAVMEKLLKNGVETRPVFPPIPALPPYQPYGFVPPVAEDVAARGINLPTHAELSDKDIKFIVHELRSAVKELL